MQIVEAVRQWWRVQSYLRKLEALGPAAIAELARDNAIPVADLRRLVAAVTQTLHSFPDCSCAWGSTLSNWLAGKRA